MTLAEQIFWWLALAFFAWFAAFPAHAAFEQTVSGYGIDDAYASSENLIFDPNSVPTSPGGFR